jgi:hypothetical protein
MTDTILQPQEHLYCSASTDDLLLVGGLPYGIALSADGGVQWQAADVDGVEEAVQCIAPDPSYLESGVILAGTAGGGILRSDDRGRHWSLCNFGLENFNVLGVTWAAPTDPETWPAWEVVFAATEDGVYRSPNGGLGWQRCAGTRGVFVVTAASANFHDDGLVMAGTEDNGLWRSYDEGRSFEQVSDAPQQINALLHSRFSWFLGNDVGIYRSSDGERWTLLPNSRPALTLLASGDDLWVGTEDGVTCLSLTVLYPHSGRPD